VIFLSGQIALDYGPGALALGLQVFIDDALYSLVVVGSGLEIQRPKFAQQLHEDGALDFDLLVDMLKETGLGFHALKRDVIPVQIVFPKVAVCRTYYSIEIYLKGRSERVRISPHDDSPWYE
jgi:hypothetical protein